MEATCEVLLELVKLDKFEAQGAPDHVKGRVGGVGRAQGLVDESAEVMEEEEVVVGPLQQRTTLP